MPQQLIDYREKFGEGDDRRVGKWLVSTLTCLPLLIPSLTLGLEWLPHSNNMWLPETYLWMSAELVGCWLLVGWLGNWDQDWVFIMVGDSVANFVIFVVAFVVAFDVSSGVSSGVMNVVMNVVALGVVFGATSGVTSGVANFMAFVVAFGVTFGIVLSGVTSGVANIVAFVVAFGVANFVEESLETGAHSWLARFVFLQLIAAHLFLIYYCFLGGWRLFV